MPTSHNPYAPHSEAVEAPVEDEKATKAAEPEKTEEEAQGVPEGSAAEVLAWVGDDKDRAQEALDAEDAGQQRIGLTRKLKEIVDSE